MVPSYWMAGAPSRREAVYDHPTPLEGEFETLTRCLESLTILRGEFEVLVLGVPTRLSLAGRVRERLEELLKPYRRRLNLKAFYPQNLRRLKRELGEKGFARFSSLLSMRGYGNVRNLCLLIPYLSGFDAAVLVDDDEMVTESVFLDRALEFLGRRWRGRIIGGVAGYYVYRGRGYRLREEETLWSVVWNKARLMNEAFKIIDSPRRLNPVSFAFGGCMAIHRRLIEEVCFDPWITRGEDIDYLLCAKLYGFEFPLDNRWSILHEPPPKQRGFWGEFEQDVYRFLYEREKLRFLEGKLGKRILDEGLDPFPGYFLKEDLEGKILLTGILALLSQSLENLLQAKSLAQLCKAFKSVEDLLRRASKYAVENAGKYFEFRKVWAENVPKLRGKVKPPLT